MVYGFLSGSAQMGTMQLPWAKSTWPLWGSPYGPRMPAFLGL